MRPLTGPNPAGSDELGDVELAGRLAHTAGQLLLRLRDTGLLTGAALGRAGDAVAHQWLSQALDHLRPEDGVLSEEGVTPSDVFRGDRLWIVDPLDGTREYAEGRDDWAVHVALVAGGAPVASAVALPGRDLVLTDGSRVEPDRRADGLRIAVSRSRPPTLARFVADRVGAELIGMGSAGYKAMAVVRGEVDAYLHAGGQYEWDTAAPVGVAVGVGLHASRVDGSELVYGKADHSSPDLLICRRELAPQLLTAILGFGEN